MSGLKIESRQAELEALHREVFGVKAELIPAQERSHSVAIDLSDEDLLDEARIAKNGAKFVALYDHGDTSPYEGDDSCADLALCSILGFWCGRDASRIDRLFRASALMRPKWDERRGAMTYGERTIGRALEGATEFYSPDYRGTALAGNAVAEPSEIEGAGQDGGSKKPTQGEILAQIAAVAEPFHTAGDEAYVSVQIGDHRETWPVNSTALKQWLTRGFYLREGKPPSTSVLRDIVRLVEAQARFEGEERAVSVRLGEADGRNYLDLGNKRWEALEIGPEGWEVVSEPPVVFTRGANTAALVPPVRGGSVEELSDFINLADQESLILIVAWLLGALQPEGPYPILILQGEQGSAKSTAARILSALVDPCEVPLRTVPRNEQDLLIAANRSWILAFDNLSRIPDWLSDAFCRLATGGGFSARRLYTDAEEVILRAKRPTLLNGIADLASRQDLADRAIVVNLPAIPPEKRQTEKALWRRFTKAQPRILGALSDAASAALRNLDQVELIDPPRMADFAQWVVAAEESLPWPSGSFMSAYRSNRAEVAGLALEHDVVAGAVSELLVHQAQWEGTAAELMDVLAAQVSEQRQRHRAWPKSPRSLSDKLRRAAPVLRSFGIEMTFLKESGRNSRRLVTLKRVGKSGVSAYATDSPNLPEGPGGEGDSDGARGAGFPGQQAEPIDGAQCDGCDGRDAGNRSSVAACSVSEELLL